MATNLRYEYVDVAIDRQLGTAHITVHGPATAQPATPDELVAAGAGAWVLAAARQLDDAVLHLRFNEPTIGTWVLRTVGVVDQVIAAEALLTDDHWLTRETRLQWARTLKRLDLSARTLIALIEPGSCFGGTLAELAFAADRTLMFDGGREDDSRAAGDRATERRQRRLVSDVERALPAGDSLLGAR